MNPVFEAAKNFIVEGLTYKIDSKEKNHTVKELQINTNPRVYFNGGNPGAHHGPLGPDGKPTVYGGLLDAAMDKRSALPVAMNKKKLYANYDERI
jgi:hypothetical protein